MAGVILETLVLPLLITTSISFHYYYVCLGGEECRGRRRLRGAHCFLRERQAFIYPAHYQL